MSANETGDWIFSEEYHRWQDQQRPPMFPFRPGSVMGPSDSWAVGLFTIEGQFSREDAARWPVPAEYDDLDAAPGYDPGLRP